MESSLSEESDSELSEVFDSSDEKDATEGSQGMRLPGAMPLVPRRNHIDEATRKKIKKGQYVNLRLLLGLRKRSIRNIQIGAVAIGTLEEMEEDNLPILKWVDAFIVFISVHIRY